MAWKSHIFLDVPLFLNCSHRDRFLAIGISLAPYANWVFCFVFVFVQYFSTSERQLDVSYGSAVPEWGKLCSVVPRTHPWKNLREGSQTLCASPPVQCWHCLGWRGKAGFWQPCPIRALFLVPYWKDDIPLLATSCPDFWHRLCGQRCRLGHFCLGWFCFISKVAKCRLHERTR